MNIYISEFITYDEAVKSKTALRLGIKNEPNDEQLLNMRHVAQTIFDPVRKFVGGPLLVSSFFRSKELNSAVPGSSKTSQHMKGEAIDLDADGYLYGSNLAIFEFIRRNLDFDELISEYPDEFGSPAWIHVSAKRIGINQKEVLVKLKSRYISVHEYKVGQV